MQKRTEPDSDIGLERHLANRTDQREASVSETIQLEQIAAEAGELNRKALEMLGRSLIDLDEVISQVMIATIANGHALLEGVPGTAKTTLCRSMARVLGMDYRRIQFTPDLLPSDIGNTHLL